MSYKDDLDAIAGGLKDTNKLTLNAMVELDNKGKLGMYGGEGGGSGGSIHGVFEYDGSASIEFRFSAIASADNEYALIFPQLVGVIFPITLTLTPEFTSYEFDMPASEVGTIVALNSITYGHLTEDNFEMAGDIVPLTMDMSGTTVLLGFCATGDFTLKYNGGGR